MKKREKREKKRKGKKEKRGKERKSELKIKILGEQILTSVHSLTLLHNFSNLILYVDLSDVELFSLHETES